MATSLGTNAVIVTGVHCIVLTRTVNILTTNKLIKLTIHINLFITRFVLTRFKNGPQNVQII